MIFRFLLCFYFIEFYGTHARSDQEIKAWFFREGIECNTEHPIAPGEILMLKENKIPDTDRAKCFVACIFKKTGMLDSKGMYDAAASVAITEKDFADDPKKLENSKKLFESCNSVNDQTVTDGQKGCERSVLLHKCFVETAPKVSNFYVGLRKATSFSNLESTFKIVVLLNNCEKVIIVDFSLGIIMPS